VKGAGDVRPFIKFPRTPHLVWLGPGRPRRDLLLRPSEAATWLRQPVIVEEKVDGANLGLSLDPDGRLGAQSRGRRLSPRDGGQWKPLWSWLARHEEALRGALKPSLLVFGEWCYATHTVVYEALPDWFVLFDVYDRHREDFWSRRRRDTRAEKAEVATVPQVAKGRFDIPRLRRLLGPSRFGAPQAEGLYLRWDHGGWLRMRAKVVRSGWVMADDAKWHRTRRNSLRPSGR
jgi:hypothetical protein